MANMANMANRTTNAGKASTGHFLQGGVTDAAARRFRRSLKTASVGLEKQAVPFDPQLPGVELLPSF